MNPARLVTNEVLLERIDGMIRETDRRFDDTNKKLDKIDAELQLDYVTQKELLPIKVIVYSFASSVLLAFLYLLIFKVGWSGHP